MAAPKTRDACSGHGGEGKDSLDAEFAGVIDQLLTEGVPADRRLGLAEKNHDIVLLARVGPEEKAIARLTDGLDQPLLHLDVIDIKEIRHLELGDYVHVELHQKIVAGIECDLPHTGPDGDQPGMVKFRFLCHRGYSLSSRHQGDQCVRTNQRY